MNAARLLALADFLEGLPPEHFDYSRWLGWSEKHDPGCGTTGCAVGWAAMMPEFQALGFGLSPVTADRPAIERFKTPDRAYASPLRFAEELFDLDDRDVSELFYPEHWSEWLGEDAPSCDATPAEVAAHIRRWVAARAG